MAKENDKEQKLRHHSLDFYACIENLREENRLKYNLCSNPLNSKVKGQSNSEEAKTFMRRFNLDYDQLMSES